MRVVQMWMNLDKKAWRQETITWNHLVKPVGLWIWPTIKGVTRKAYTCTYLNIHVQYTVWNSLNCQCSVSVVICFNWSKNKTENMVISSKRNKPYHPSLQMNDQDLHVVNSHKHLGVIISDNGQWNDHIDYIVKKTYNRLNIMRKSRIFLDRYSLEKKLYFFYKTFNGVRWCYMG